MTGAFDRLAVQLLARAQTIVAARIEELRLARTNPAARWRKASLLWPSFTKG